MRFFRRKFSEEEKKLLDFLGKIRLFQGLNDTQKLVFAPYLYLRSYKQNEVVFFRKDPSQALYLLKEGKITLELDIEESFENILELEAITSFGHNALLPNSKRIFNAFVNSPLCYLYVLPQVNVIEVFKRNPEIKAQVLENVAWIHDQNFAKLCQVYRETKGFFELGEIFREVRQGI